MRPSKTSEWQKRLYLPAYQVKAAAGYAGVTSQTVRNWQRESGDGTALFPRETGTSLSYMQLQELAIVSAMRRLGVKLKSIRIARDYLGKLFDTTHPFADERVKSDGQDVLVQVADRLPEREAILLVASQNGQYAWADIIGNRFDEFEYEKGVALKWHVAGFESPVLIDPRISFGAPMVRGVATWAIKGRWAAGESVETIANDFDLMPTDVGHALKFEGIDLNELRAWIRH